MHQDARDTLPAPLTSPLPLRGFKGQAGFLLLVVTATARPVQAPARVLAPRLLSIRCIIWLHGLTFHVRVGHQVDVTVTVPLETDRYHSCWGKSSSQSTNVHPGWVHSAQTAGPCWPSTQSSPTLKPL